MNLNGIQSPPLYTYIEYMPQIQQNTLQINTRTSHFIIYLSTQNKSQIKSKQYIET